MLRIDSPRSYLAVTSMIKPAVTRVRTYRRGLADRDGSDATAEPSAERHAMFNETRLRTTVRLRLCHYKVIIYLFSRAVRGPLAQLPWSVTGRHGAARSVRPHLLVMKTKGIHSEGSTAAQHRGPCGVPRMPVTTIYDWRVDGKGPCGVRVGRHVKFIQSERARLDRGLARGTARRAPGRTVT